MTGLGALERHETGPAAGLPTRSTSFTDFGEPASGSLARPVSFGPTLPRPGSSAGRRRPGSVAPLDCQEVVGP